jgi:hypothetical protein
VITPKDQFGAGEGSPVLKPTELSERFTRWQIGRALSMRDCQVLIRKA